MDYKEELATCVKILKKGGIILYPTDNIWGLGCDATNEAAVAKIFELKQREEQKSMIILLSKIDDIKNYSKIPSDKIKNLLTTTVKPLTIIYPTAKNVALNLVAKDGSIAIRIVRDTFCEALINFYGKPIVSTSANISGERSPKIFDEISIPIKIGADYIVQHRQKDKTLYHPSKIMFWKTDDDIIVIRE